MTINEFAGKVCGAVERELGGNCKVEVREVRKNNGVLLHGLVILGQNRNVAPTIYLESFLESYEEGMAFAEVVRGLLGVYRKEAPKASIDMEFFRSYDKVKDRICYRLINRQGNQELLEEVPHIEFLDLAICFYYAYRGEQLGEGSILVYNSHMEMWKVSTADLLAVAKANTPRLFPWVCSSMDEILAEATGGMVDVLPGEDVFRNFPMRVLSNYKRTQGAVCMIYPNLLEKLTAQGRRSVYILPSSVHEVILLQDTGAGCPRELKKMIMEVNRTQVAPEEVLSDSLYFYDYSEKRVKIIS